MSYLRVGGIVAWAAVCVAGAGACFTEPLDNPGPVDAGGDVDAGESETLCAKYGGQATADLLAGEVVQTFVADCRIGVFFSSLSAERAKHVRDCLAKQIGVLLKCPGVKYDFDQAGVACRDMKVTHARLGITEDDFAASVEGVVTVLQGAGVEQADIDALAPAILFLDGDIVQSARRGLSQDACGGGGVGGNGGMSAGGGGGAGGSGGAR
ncbi:MAG: hypothetical protein WKG00_30270 [Polyangiaceae bacterium]